MVRVGLPVRDSRGRQIGHVVQVYQDDPEGPTVLAHLSAPSDRVRQAFPAPPWVHGRRVRLGLRAVE